MNARRLVRNLIHLALRPGVYSGIRRVFGWVPQTRPGDDYLKRYATAEWPDYQTWIDRNEVSQDTARWRTERSASLEHPGPLLSILTPVYNTDHGQLHECVDSVLFQSYPYWELWLVDDASSSDATLRMLRQLCRQDVRIRCLRNRRNLGISRTTNRALNRCRGEFVLFLDHDDLLAPGSLYRIGEYLRAHQETDFLYTDRDMLSPQRRRWMYLMKPDWSPESLLAGNYLFHACVYRTKLVRELGGLRAEFDGSQDYDLALRATERSDHIGHLPQVLYHWRQHEQSVALAHDCKDYAYQAGQRALQEALQRRGLDGRVSEIDSLWRGNYRVELVPPPANDVLWTRLSADRRAWADSLQKIDQGREPFLVFTRPDLEPADETVIAELAAWLQVDGVGLSAGKILGPDGKILHAGLVLRPDGRPHFPYRGYPAKEPGYMAYTAITHNVFAPHPWAFACRRELWEQLRAPVELPENGFAVLDLALRAHQQGLRSVFTPFALFLSRGVAGDDGIWPQTRQQAFALAWKETLRRGDPYYSRALTLEHSDVRLRLPHAPAAAD